MHTTSSRYVCVYASCRKREVLARKTTARPVRLDPSHFYHGGLSLPPTKAAPAERIQARRERDKKDRARRVEPLWPLRCLALPSPQQLALSLQAQLFAKVQSPRDSERRTQRPRVGLTRNPPTSRLGCRKQRCLTSSSPARRYTTPSACPAVSQSGGSTTLANTLPRPARKTTRERKRERVSRLHRPREKIASLRFKRYKWQAWPIARWLLSRSSREVDD